MKYLNRTNINTGRHFDDLFKEDFNYYDNYQNIDYYNKKYGLNLFSGETYLDYGCGNGGSLSRLRQKFPELDVMGVDISDYVIKENKKKYPDCRFLMAEEYLVSGFVSGHIVSSHVFEHLESPKEFAVYLFKRASKTLTIIVPYKDSWIDCQEHLWAFDEKSFDFLNPSLVIRGLTNQAGNTEVVYHWDKNEPGGRVAKFRKSEPYSYYGKKIFAGLKRFLPNKFKKLIKDRLGLNKRS